MRISRPALPPRGMSGSRREVGPQVCEEPRGEGRVRSSAAEMTRWVGSRESRFCQELAEPPRGWHQAVGSSGAGRGRERGWAEAGPEGPGWHPAARAPPGPDLRRSPKPRGAVHRRPTV